MKKEYIWFIEFKNCATDLGWNEAKQNVECSKAWWDEHFARCNNFEKGIKCSLERFKEKGPKHLDDLHMLFDKVYVTGVSASCSGDISSGQSSDNNITEVESDDVKLAALKKSKKEKKKKCNCSREDILKC